MILTLTSHSGTAFVSMASRARSLAGRRFASQVPETAVELDSVPATFAQCISSAQSAAKAAIDDGFRLMEIEFPPLQADMLESPDCSAYDVSKANVRLAVDFAKSFVADGKRVAIMMPDNAEKVRGRNDRPPSGLSCSLTTCPLLQNNSVRAAGYRSALPKRHDSQPD